MYYQIKILLNCKRVLYFSTFNISLTNEKLNSLANGIQEITLLKHLVLPLQLSQICSCDFLFFLSLPFLLFSRFVLNIEMQNLFFFFLWKAVRFSIQFASHFYRLQQQQLMLNFPHIFFLKWADTSCCTALCLAKLCHVTSQKTIFIDVEEIWCCLKEEPGGKKTMNVVFFYQNSWNLSTYSFAGWNKKWM